MNAMRLPAAILILGLGLFGCDVVPKESVELSNTVGRDLEEVHRAHHALALAHFRRIEDDVNTFIDRQYRPAYIRKFASEFDLAGQVETIVRQDPSKLLPVMTRFVEIAVRDIEAKRSELLEPIETQKFLVIEEIDRAHRQIRAAHAVVTGHLASVRKVREVQNELLAEAGLEDLRERLATRTATVSDQVQALVSTGETASAGLDDAGERIAALDRKIEEVRARIDSLRR